MNNHGFRRLTGSHDQYARVRAPTVNQRLARWLDNNRHSPFFVFVNYFDAHGPYCPPAPFNSKFGPKRPSNMLPIDFRNELRQQNRPRCLSAEELQIEIDAYDGCIAYLDQEIGRMLAALSDRGILDNTLVIVVGDHGEEFAEHGILEHSGSLYLPSLHVPLILAMPGRVPENTRIPTPVKLRDLRTP